METEMLDCNKQKLNPNCIAALTSIDSRLQTIEVHVAETKAAVEKLHGSIYVGNGSPSLTTRLDRLEQEAGKHRWLTRAIALAVIGLIFAVATDAIKNRVVPSQPVPAAKQTP